MCNYGVMIEKKQNTIDKKSEAPFIGESVIDPSETMLRPSFEVLEKERKSLGISVAKVYNNVKSLEQLHSRVINGKSEPTDLLIWHLILGLKKGWLNSVPEPAIKHETDEWGQAWARAAYAPHPLIVEPQGIFALLSRPAKISGIEAPDIPDTEDGQERLINFIEEVENRKTAKLVSKKVSEQVRERIEIGKMLSATFVGRNELEAMDNLFNEARMILLAFPTFSFTQFEEYGEYVVGWQHRFHLMPIKANTAIPPFRKFYLAFDEETDVSFAWSKMPTQTNLYEEFEMSPFENFCF